ncbi:UPF0236 family protein [Mycoplasmopsis agalactiae]|nr:UPF0236 family protein [Mycoplasmopsis agalactiae]MCE6056371.1 UPF0236 family protein [Mycoplasmopsis agalactiae]
MNKFDIDIFDEVLNTTKSLYAAKAKELNDKELYFRTVLRKSLYPDWAIFRKTSRVWITLGGIFTLNITMYETTDTNGKRKRFTYYHDEKLKQISKFKYDEDVIKLALKFYFEGNKIPDSLKRIFPSKQLVNYYLKAFNLKEKIEKKNNEILANIESNLQKTNSKLMLEMDDFYIFHKSERIRKMRVRQVIMHTVNGSKLSNIINMFFTKNIDEATTKFNDMQFIKTTVSKQLNKFNSNREIIVNGDGARWIKHLANELNASYSLDLFHIKKAINDTFGTNKFASKENKTYFKNNINYCLNKPWKNAFSDAVFTKNELMFHTLYNEFFAYSSIINMPKVIHQKVQNFYEFIKNNSLTLFKNNENDSSYTEHFVYNSFKKHIKKDQSLYCFELIKLRVIYKNIAKNQATLFY